MTTSLLLNADSLRYALVSDSFTFKEKKHVHGQSLIGRLASDLAVLQKKGAPGKYSISSSSEHMQRKSCLSEGIGIGQIGKMEEALQLEPESENDIISEPQFVSVMRKTHKKGSRNKQEKTISKTKLKNIQKREKENERKSLIVKAFCSFYESQYGSRWSSLLNSLMVDFRSSCLINRFADQGAVAQFFEQYPRTTRISFLKLEAYGIDGRFPHPERDSQNLLTYYLLDAASVLVTEALHIQPGDRVLDMCAAPGGKTLAILQQLDLCQGSLTANEISDDRRRRLWKVIRDYIPEELQEYVHVTGRDGTRWGEVKMYDKVLIDAPCSSDRHLLHDIEELSSWTPKRPSNCAKRQFGLLSAALKSVRAGGLVVYSTCSLGYQENDGVIAKALKKLNIEFEIIHGPWQVGEKTEHGWIVLPDVAEGWGPIYFATLRRTLHS